METLKDKIIKVLKPFIEFANERLNREKAENTDYDAHIVYAFNRKAITIGDLKELKQLESELSRLKDEPAEQSDKLTAEEILEKQGFKIMCHKKDGDVLNEIFVKPLIEAMEEYASQFVGEVTDRETQYEKSLRLIDEYFEKTPKEGVLSAEIPSDIVTKMQKEFEPNPDTSFRQGMYSGYAFGLQDGYKFAHSQFVGEVTDEMIEKWARTIRIDFATDILIEGAKALRDGLIGK